MPISSSNDDDDNEQNAEDIFHISKMEYLPTTQVDIQREMKPDKTLSHVYEQVQNG